MYIEELTTLSKASFKVLALSSKAIIEYDNELIGAAIVEKDKIFMKVCTCSNIDKKLIIWYLVKALNYDTNSIDHTLISEYPQEVEYIEDATLTFNTCAYLEIKAD